MDRDLRRSAIISFAVHATLIVVAIVTLPMQPLNPSADQTLDVTLVGPTQPQTAQTKGQVAAASDQPVVHQGPVNPVHPKPQPVVAPPPPPPPRPPQKVTSPAKPTPPKPIVPKPPAPDKSATHQPHDVKNPMPLSQNVLNTLSQLRVNQKQEKAPTSQYNPDQGGAPHGGGSPNSTANSQLNEADRNAIGAHVRPCWGIDAGAPGVDKFAVQLLVTTDASGTVREARVAPASQGNMGDPIYAAFAQRAVAAVENYQCATLPLPHNMLGSVHSFLFNFTP